jgi:signal transduction histidine kinase
LKLLKIGAETEKLAACKLSLLLGIYTPENRVANFLKIAAKILQTDKSLLAFSSEPYGWHFAQNLCSAFTLKSETGIEPLFDGHLYIDEYHINYEKVKIFLHRLGLEFKRFIAVSFVNDDDVMGYAVFFDEKTEMYHHEQLSTLQETIKVLVGIITLCRENAELKETNEQQAALNFSKTKFFQVISHDLRAPFHGLLGFSEILARERETLTEKNIQEISTYLFDTAQSTYNLLESLLNWAMVEGGRFICHPINFDLSQAAQIVVDVLSGVAIKKNIKLVNQIEVNTKVYADINMITSVIQNLVSNALKFTPVDGSGEVIIRTVSAEDQVYIYIHDTGLGMSAQQISTLFEPELKVSIRGTKGEKGAGLGLVLCKRFVDLNHGTVSVSSREGEGTIFKVGLPKERNIHKNIT